MVLVLDPEKHYWWWYIHENGSIQVKRHFRDKDTELSIQDANESPFVQEVYGAFMATDREDAIMKIKSFVTE